MTGLRAKWSAYIDRQHRCPSGLVGRVIGERMRRQHTPETDWSIGLLGLQPADRLLEIGFGAGRGLALALERVNQGRVVGVDLSPAMVRAAARRNRTALDCGRLALLRGDLANLPFGGQQFEKILSIHSFYFWPDPAEVCLRLVRMLARGGRLVSTFATARTLRSGERVYWPIHQQANVLVQEFQRHPNIDATLAYGPDSRQFNNVAIVIDKI
jgi:SAM-dependent methyltransferase